MSVCRCVPIEIDLGEVAEHDSECPNAYDHLHTAEDIAAMRQCLMLWAEHTGDPRGTVPRMAVGVSARAVELGLEKP